MAKVPLHLLFVLSLLCQGYLADDDDDDDDVNHHSRDRFWRHHVSQKSLIIDDVDFYSTLETCLSDNLPAAVAHELNDENDGGVVRSVGRRIIDREGKGSVVLVEIKNAISPSHAMAVQTLATCVRRHIPGMHESRSLQREVGEDDDDDDDDGERDMGGNNPTHLVPFISVFFPTVVEEMFRTLDVAFLAGGWGSLVVHSELVDDELRGVFPWPKDAGMRASEHLTYESFPSLAFHNDGADTAYTMNFAFSGPDEYEGGVFKIVDELEEVHSLKPDKYSALVFLGGYHAHSITTIHSGHREMYSTEFWSKPDIPAGASLWSSTGRNMDAYIALCDRENQTAGVACNATFFRSKELGSNKYASRNQTKASTRFLSEDEEPHFLVPRNLPLGHINSVTFRSIRRKVEGGAYVIGLPSQLLKELQQYITDVGIMDLAQTLLYDNPQTIQGKSKMHTLRAGLKWTTTIAEWKDIDTDMIRLNPADEECFESLLTVLRDGDFDVVLKQMGDYFDLDGLMIKGIEALFLSHFFDRDETSQQIRSDLPGSKGSFYSVLVPIRIPDDGGTNRYYVGDESHRHPINLRRDRGLILGADARHGVAECDHRKQRNFQLLLVVYLADVNETNAALIAWHSTGRWPLKGDVEWILAQRDRHWSHAKSNSLSDDEGRASIRVVDRIDDCNERKHLCDADLNDEFRSQCPLTCRLYLPDDEYDSLLERMICVDRDELCPTFAEDGECEKNPSWMIPNCKKSCGCRMRRREVDVGDDCVGVVDGDCPTTRG